MEPFEILAQSQKSSLAMVEQVTEGDRLKPTPCEGWNVSALLDKIVTSGHLFAALCRGEQPAAQYNLLFPTPVAGNDPATTHAAAISECTDAFTESKLEGEMMGPLGVMVPRRVGLMVRSLDATINTWDLAMSLGLEPNVPPAVVEALIPFAEGFLPKVREKTDHPRFGEPLTTAAGGLSQLVAMSGRDPAWQAA